MAIKDHYRTLGVSPKAKIGDIKKAYRDLAKQFHPDKNPDNKFAEARFLEIHEAYSVLSDDDSRAFYDNERWLSGISNKKEVIVTPEWLLARCKELNTSLQEMDLHRISYKALQEYLLLILEDAHIGILQEYNNEPINSAVVNECLLSCQQLHFSYLQPIIERLKIIAQPYPQLLNDVIGFEKQKEDNARFEKLFPYIIIIITLCLCVMMYFYGT